MRVLLSDGAGLTARQCATVLGQAGYEVEALSPETLCLCRFTRRVRRVHRVPAYGTDPFGWLDAALEVYTRGRFDVLLPTQEQVAVLSAASERLRAAGVATAVPPFEALVQVQDKLSAFGTLTEFGLPQPISSLITTAGQLAEWRQFPVYLKTPIGTASAGARLFASRAELDAAGPDWAATAERRGLLAQSPISGPLVMTQSAFDHGRLVAFHANIRVREGARGGASHKRSLRLPDVRGQLASLGAGLSWHGALSADVILGDGGPMFIDINPRLVEPINALRSGVDLVGAMVDLARHTPVKPQPVGAADVRTHQLLLAILGAASSRGRRRDVLAELQAAATRRGDYRGSAEELTPLRHDLPSAALVGLAAVSTLIRPRSWGWFANTSVSAYALSPTGWSRILDHLDHQP